MKNVYLTILEGKNLLCKDEFHKFILIQEGKEYYQVTQEQGYIFKDCVTGEINEIVNYLDEFTIVLLNKNDIEF